MSNGSCLAAKLENYVPLGEDERKLLAKLEEDTEEISAGDAIFKTGDESERLYVVKTGWLFSSSMLADGRRQVLRIHYPGDIIGVAHLPFKRAMHDLEAISDGVLCPFPKSSLEVIIRQSPRLSALLWTFSIIEQSTYADRIRTLGRMNASERVAHFLLEIASRLRLTKALSDDYSFKLPLNQGLLGDAIGLTNVYVSRTLSQLEKDGYISRTGTLYTIKRWADLVDLAEFIDRFAEMDISWFPGVA